MTELLSRLLAKGEPVGECLEWSGCRDDAGYGRTKAKGRTSLAHRLVFEEANGIVLPRSVEVRHRCDNPPCILLDHLISGSHLENMQDMVDRGRGRKGGWTSATAEQVRRILSYPEQFTSTAIAREVDLSPEVVRRIRFMPRTLPERVS